MSSAAEDHRRRSLAMTAAAITSIVAHRLAPRDYDTATAGRLLATTTVERELSGETDPLTVADLWEVLAGDWNADVPLSDHAAAAAWDIADSYTADNNYGGPFDAALPATPAGDGHLDPDTRTARERARLDGLLQATYRPAHSAPGPPRQTTYHGTARHAAEPDVQPELGL